MEIKKIRENVYEIKEKDMLVPGIIYASEKLFEAIKQDKTLEQLKNMAFLKGIQKAAYIMPDAHRGYGFAIGGVAAFDLKEGIVSPGGVGYDINCGIRTFKTTLTIKQLQKKKKEILDQLFRDVPAGLGSKSMRISKEELFEVLEKGSEWALKNNFGLKKDLEHTEEYGRMKKASTKFISDRAIKRGLPQLGSLGAGNHFLEIQKVEEIFDEKIAEAWGIKKDDILVMIHCGSRGLGHQVASDYITKMEMKIGWKNLPDRELINAPIQSELGQEYIKSMFAAVNYAFCNRQIITHQARKSFERIFGINPEKMELIYGVAHNIAKFEKHRVNGKIKEVCIHRKGATRSFGPGREELPASYQKTGQPVILPGSMGTASYLLVGTKEAEELSFSSTAHGAGRVMSRTKARKSLQSEKIKKQLQEKDILLKAHSMKGIIEEAPEVYKDVEEVVRVSHNLGLARKVARLIPLAVIKG